MEFVQQLLLLLGVGFFVIFFFGMCIFVHELGHFLVARWRKLHVIAFSIGFKKAWAVKRNGIEYRIGWLPFGGYVDLPQIDATGKPKDEKGNPLPPAPPIDRILTALAGPVCNIIFGFALGSFLWWHGIPQETPKMHGIKVAAIEEQSPEYESGLRAEDEIIAVNGRKFYGTWEDFVREILFTVGKVRLTVRDGGTERDVIYQPVSNREIAPDEDLAYPFFRPRIPVILGKPKPGQPAAAAGIKLNDEVLAIDGVAVENLGDFVTRIRESEGKALDFLIKRGDRELSLSGIKPVLMDMQGDKFYAIGVSLMFYAHPSPWRQFLDTIDLTYKSLRGIVFSVGNKLGFTEKKTSIRPRHMSGPVGIVRVIGITVYRGQIIRALYVVVLITFSLAFLNIMPFPVLDGGHIVMALYEMLVGKPVSERLVKPAFAVFIVLLLSLMAYVTVFDVQRSFGGVFRQMSSWFRGEDSVAVPVEDSGSEIESAE